METTDNSAALAEILAKLENLDRKLSALTTDTHYNTKTPLLLREAAEVCHVELEWLRERVKWKEIPAYRHAARHSWRVFPKDVTAFVMASNNIERPRRKPLLG